MFKRNFKVVEIRESGVIYTTYMRGTKKQIKNDIERMIKNCKRFELFDSEGITIWA